MLKLNDEAVELGRKRFRDGVKLTEMMAPFVNKSPKVGQEDLILSEFVGWAEELIEVLRKP